jgi:hypothetical protein
MRTRDHSLRPKWTFSGFPRESNGQRIETIPFAIQWAFIEGRAEWYPSVPQRIEWRRSKPASPARTPHRALFRAFSHTGCIVCPAAASSGALGPPSESARAGRLQASTASTARTGYSVEAVRAAHGPYCDMLHASTATLQASTATPQRRAHTDSRWSALHALSRKGAFCRGAYATCLLLLFLSLVSLRLSAPVCLCVWLSVSRSLCSAVETSCVGDESNH